MNTTRKFATILATAVLSLGVMSVPASADEVPPAGPVVTDCQAYQLRLYILTGNYEVATAEAKRLGGEVAVLTTVNQQQAQALAQEQARVAARDRRIERLKATIERLRESRRSAR